jgi:hypothetical protein
MPEIVSRVQAGGPWYQIPDRCLPLSLVLLWILPRERAGAQPGSLEILGGIGTMPSILPNLPHWFNLNKARVKRYNLVNKELFLYYILSSKSYIMVIFC